jgi:hypothetical protein
MDLTDYNREKKKLKLENKHLRKIILMYEQTDLLRYLIALYRLYYSYTGNFKTKTVIQLLQVLSLYIVLKTFKETKTTYLKYFY